LVANVLPRPNCKNDSECEEAKEGMRILIVWMGLEGEHPEISIQALDELSVLLKESGNAYVETGDGSIEILGGNGLKGDEYSFFSGVL
jgi:hypothetical protein